MPTLADVAKAAGVSISTVSHVINHRGDIPAETSARVLQAMERLDYRPNRFARNLVRRRSEEIGLLIESADWFNSPIHGSVMGGIAESVAANRYSLELFLNTDVDVSLTAEWRARRLDGIIVLSMPLSARTMAALDRTELPVVVIDGWWESDSVRFLNADNRTAGRWVGEHLLARGHRRLGFLGAGDEFASRLRQQGFAAALAAAGCPLRPEFIGDSDWDYDRAYRLAGAWLKGRDRPTAIFAASDRLALAVYAAAYERGLAVGRDLAVVGFDDTEAARQIRPTLSSVRQEGRAIGRRAVDMLLAQIAGEPVQDETAPVELRVRASSGGLGAGGS